MTKASSIASHFEYDMPYSTYRRHKLRSGLFKKITKHSLPLFFRGSDIISQPLGQWGA
jgi:hypothetical protein